jgi:hypothetical protein
MFLRAILLVEAVSSNRATIIRSFTAFSCFSQIYHRNVFVMPNTDEASL